MNLLMQGAKKRHTSPTLMNAESSRSHSVFSINVTSKKTINGLSTLKVSKINFVDLAGSERQSKTNSDGERLKEAAIINKSLLCLGQVINNLIFLNKGKKRHVNYRESKLTFLLRDSLGGNSRTFMIAAVSPAIS